MKSSLKMRNTLPRFDMARDPIRTRWYLKPLTKLLSWPDMLLHEPIIRRQGTEGLKPPYILLCNHNAFMDFKVATQIIYPKEELYYFYRESIGKPCRPGLA